jgi:hypothetical protein
MNKFFLAENPLEEIPNPLTSPKFFQLFDFISHLIFSFYSVGIIFFTIAIVIGGYFILTSAGDEKRIKSGKKIILLSIIFLVLIFLLPLIKRGLLDFIKFLSGIFK